MNRQLMMYKVRVKSSDLSVRESAGLAKRDKNATFVLLLFSPKQRYKIKCRGGIMRESARMASAKRILARSGRPKEYAQQLITARLVLSF